MLVQFIQACEGTLATALVVMVMSVLLPEGEGVVKARSARLRTGGLALGVTAAIVFAALRGTGIITQRTAVNVPTLIACVVCDLLGFTAIIAGAAARPGTRRYALCNAAAACAIAMMAFRALPGVVLQLTNFIVPGEPVFTSEMLLRALGFVLGIALSVVAAAIFRTMRGTLPRWSFVFVALLLEALVLAEHAVDLAKVLQSVRRIRLRGTSFRVLVQLVNHSTWFTIGEAAVFLVLIVMSIVYGMRMKPTAPISGRDFRFLPGMPVVYAMDSEPNAAVVRMRLKYRRHAIAAAVWSLVMVAGITVTLTYGVAKTQETITLSPPEAYSMSDGTITITYAQVSDGHLHRFEYTAADGTVMRFIIIKKNGSAYGIGLDACANCGDAGYYEKDGKIICKRCGVAINLATIGFSGGCNPIPFDYTSGDGAITIQTSTLDALSSNFR